MKQPTRAANILKALTVAAVLGLFAASCLRQSGERVPVAITSSETPPPPATRASDSTFENFSHQVPEHKQFACDSCHNREKGVKGSLKIQFAGHEACIGCHLNQFISPEKKELSNPQKAFCANCHSDLQSVPPPVRVFPAKFEEGFNMKFDHAVHSRGDAEPREGCNYCHDPRGPGKSIPVSVSAHANCFACHTPESSIGQCSECHDLAPYNRTPPSRYAFRQGARFSHADHTSAQGVNCADCHLVRAGGQGRQVTNISVQQHNVAPAGNCAECHNGSRAFNGNDFLRPETCSRCHTGKVF